MKNSPSHTHNLTFSFRISHSGYDIRSCLLASEPLPYLSKALPHHYISMPYGSNLTSNFSVPYVCISFTMLRTSCTQLEEWNKWKESGFRPLLCRYRLNCARRWRNELYNIHGETHAPTKVKLQSEHESYRSNVDTFDTKTFGHTNRRISHSSPHFVY